jgi:hypothetical protein
MNDIGALKNAGIINGSVVALQGQLCDYLNLGRGEVGQKNWQDAK